MNTKKLNEKSRKRRRKNRRSIQPSDFRKTPKVRVQNNFLFCGNHGFISRRGLARAFPDRKKRLAYVRALCKEMEVIGELN